MIGSLRGHVLERDLETGVLIEVSGVGYLVTVTPSTLAELEPGSPAFLYVHHHIREDAQTLYGFATRSECTTFRVLIGTHGVGPALAMAILGTHAPGALVDVVTQADVAALTLVPGVGKKTAERLLVELRSRLSVPELDPVPTAAGGSPDGHRTSAVADVRVALAGLGYGTDEVRDALRELAGRDDAAESDAATLLRDALRLLGARRA